MLSKSDVATYQVKLQRRLRYKMHSLLPVLLLSISCSRIRENCEAMERDTMAS